MNQEAWPTPQSSTTREPLPRVEDLPVAEQGYEQESVKAAFDSFYRHAAQLDAALRTLEAVDSFHRQAAALRADLRALRTAGWTQQSLAATPAYGYGARAPREGISPAVWRIAGEVVFLIAVAVVLGVAKLEWWVIVPTLALAWLLVGVIEWAAGRDRHSFARAAPSAPAAEHPVVEAPVERAEEAEAVGWAAFEEAQEPSDAMTMIGGSAESEPVGAQSEPAEARGEEEPSAAEEPSAEEAAAVEEEPEPERVVEAAAVAEAEPQAEPEPAASGQPEAGAEPPRRRWWRRAVEEEDAPPAEVAPEPPRHVRVLAADERQDTIDPWERAFDDTGELRADESEDTDTNERLDTVAADAEPPRRRFRRR